MQPQDVLAFWFADGPSVWREAWFKRSDAFDADCKDRFAATLEAARAGTLDHWAATPEGTLALVIVLDQMPRNIHRGTAGAFAADSAARRVVAAAIAHGFDRALAPLQRVFLYLPFEHSESLADQETSVRLFDSLRGEYEGGDKTSDYARRHRDVIRRFGRFPHRNAALGRASTVEEEAYLAEPGAGF